MIGNNRTIKQDNKRTREQEGKRTGEQNNNIEKSSANFTKMLLLFWNKYIYKRMLLDVFNMIHCTLCHNCNAKCAMGLL